MSVEITVVRHGETTANQAGVWQGWSDAALTPNGREQVEHLAARVGANGYDIVASSDLGRAVDTAAALGAGVEVDRRWRELHLGEWEGLSQEEIHALNPDVAGALRIGEDVAFGGGERMSELLERVSEAFFDLADRLDDGGRAIVISHGGALMGLTAAVLGGDLRGRLLRLTNTSLTTFRVDGQRVQMAVFNDATHLPGAPVRSEAGSTHVHLIRHGQTTANVEHRWQGHQDGALTDEGRAQVERLAGRLPELDVLYTSPLGRAQETAAVLGEANGLAPGVIQEIKEIGFGAWENKTREEIAELDPDGLAALERGEDIVRGGTGEVFAAVQRRMAGALEALAHRHRGGAVGAVSHGGAIRAYAASVLGLEFGDRHRLPVLGNTAMARFAYGAKGPALAGWNLAPHLASPPP